MDDIYSSLIAQRSRHNAGKLQSDFMLIRQPSETAQSQSDERSSASHEGRSGAGTIFYGAITFEGGGNKGRITDSSLI